MARRVIIHAGYCDLYAAEADHDGIIDAIRTRLGENAVHTAANCGAQGSNAPELQFCASYRAPFSFCPCTGYMTP